MTDQMVEIIALKKCLQNLQICRSMLSGAFNTNKFSTKDVIILREQAKLLIALANEIEESKS